MYKGKFDQKARKSTTDIQELVAQRNASPTQEPSREPRKVPEAARTPLEKPAPGKAPRPQAAPKKQPATQSAPQKKKGPRLGGVIFYTLYFLFIFVFFLGTFIGLTWLKGWLNDFELSQPTVRAQQVFTQLFSNPDWGALYDASGSQDSPYEGKAEFVSYMEQKIDPSQLTFLKTSAGLSGDMKYEVRMGNEKVATFTLVDKNNVGDQTGLESLGGELPDWQLGAVDVFFEREGTYYIEKLDGHVTYINDVLLDDENAIIQIATTKAEDYLPIGTTGASMCTQQVTGLMAVPTVTIFDKDGNPMEVTYDESTRTFTERLESNTISMEETAIALEAAKTSCLWMIEAVKDRGTVAKYFDNTSDAYTNIVSNRELWMQDYSNYEFLNDSVTNYARYSDSLFSARVAITLRVTRTDGSTRDFDFNQSMFFRKSDTGKWLCYAATNVDVSQPVGKVRLTFMNGETLLTTDMYYTDAKEIITPLITPVPEGKVFSGWVRRDEDENGVTLTVVFQPDSTGKVIIPEGTTLTPMTLYALFEDAGAASVSVPETTPETTATAEGA